MTVNFRCDEWTILKAKQAADMERRSLSGYIKYLIHKDLRKKDLED